MPKKKISSSSSSSSKESSHKRKRSPQTKRKSPKRKSPEKDIIGNLPEEIIAQIAFFLPTEDVKRLSQVNRLHQTHLIPVLAKRRQIEEQLAILRARLTVGDIVEFKKLPFFIKKINNATVVLENIQDGSLINAPIEEIIVIHSSFGRGDDD